MFVYAVVCDAAQCYAMLCCAMQCYAVAPVSPPSSSHHHTHNLLIIGKVVAHETGAGVPTNPIQDSS
eukprot:2841684-Pyramimonas_sp.AAC.1